MQLMGSDMVPESGLLNGNNVSFSSSLEQLRIKDTLLLNGNNVSLILNCSNEDELKSVYDKLSDGGYKDHPLEISFFGSLFGDLTDKFGNHWLLNCPLK
jgi:PhnB protein